MYISSFAYSRGLIFSLYVITGGVLSASEIDAAELLRFDFENSKGNLELTADSIADGLSAGAWADTDGTLTSFAGTPGLALAARSWDNGNSLHFILNIEPGIQVQLAALDFDQRASSSGASDWALFIDGLEIASGATTTTFTSEHIAFASLPIAETTMIALVGSGGTSSSGTWRIDNFVLGGSLTTVPLPAGFVLMLSSILGFVGLRLLAPM